MLWEDAVTCTSKINQPTAEEVMGGLNYILCINELMKYKVIFASKEALEIIKEKSDGISLENVVFVEAPIDRETVCVVKDNMLKYTILLDKGLIQKNPEFESRSIVYARGNGKSPFSFYDVKEE